MKKLIQSDLFAEFVGDLSANSDPEADKIFKTQDNVIREEEVEQSESEYDEEYDSDESNHDESDREPVRPASVTPTTDEKKSFEFDIVNWTP